MASSSFFAHDFAHELARLMPTLQLVETEDSWQKIEKSIAKLDALTKSGAYKGETYVPLIKEHAAPSIVSALLSERTRLSGTAADFCASAAPRLGVRFEALVSTFVPPLLVACGRTNKVALARAKKCLLIIARHCKLASLTMYMREAVHEKAVTLRLVALEVTATLLQIWRQQLQMTGELDRRQLSKCADIEDIVRASATDRDAEARQLSKRIFEMYADVWPDRVDSFTAALTPTTRRYLALSSQKVQPAPAFALAPSESYLAPPKQSSRIHSERRPLGAVQVPQSTYESSRVLAEEKKAAVVREAPLPEASRSAAHRNLSSHRSKPSPHRADELPVEPRREAKGLNKTCAPQPTVMAETIPTKAQEKQQIQKSSDSGERDENQRAALNGEAKKQSASTPSRAIAARLALEQFDLRKRQRDREGVSDQGVKKEGSGSNRAALAAFAIAASKKLSPRRLPLRIPLTNQPSKLNNSTLPEEVAKSAEPAHEAQAIKGAATLSTPTPPADVFESRPISPSASPVNPVGKRQSPRSAGHARSATASKKIGSTVSRNLGARGQLLGVDKPQSPAAKPVQRTTLEQKRLALARQQSVAAEASPMATASESPSTPKKTNGQAPASNTSTPTCVKSMAFSTPVRGGQGLNLTPGRSTPSSATHILRMAQAIPLPASPMRGVPSPLSDPAAANTARSPPSVMLRQMALAALAGQATSTSASIATSSPLATRTPERLRHGLASHRQYHYSSPLKAAPFVPLPPGIAAASRAQSRLAAQCARAE